jgi:hypothetical protein
MTSPVFPIAIPPVSHIVIIAGRGHGLGQIPRTVPRGNFHPHIVDVLVKFLLAHLVPFSRGFVDIIRIRLTDDLVPVVIGLGKIALHIHIIQDDGKDLILRHIAYDEINRALSKLARTGCYQNGHYQQHQVVLRLVCVFHNII